MYPKDELRDELRELSPFLEKLKKEKEGFRVPENYFQNLGEELLEKLSPLQQHQPAPPRHSWWSFLLEPARFLLQPRHAMAFATGLVLLVAGWYFLEKNAASNDACQDIACLTIEEVRAYIDSNMDRFDTGTILEAGAKDGALENIDLPASIFEGKEMEDALLDALEGLDPEQLEGLF